MTEQINESELNTLSLKKLFWKYSLPTISAMLVNGLYTFTDGLFIGRYIGADGLAAINVLWTVYGIIIGFGIMIGLSASALFSIEKGKRNQKEAASYLANGFLLLIIMSFLSMALIKFFARPLMSFQLSDSPQALNLAMQYFSVLCPFIFFSLFGVAVPMFLRNDEHPVFSTKLLFLGAIINVIADYFLVYRFNLSMKGAATATLLAQATISIIGVSHFFTKRANLRLTLSDFTPHFLLCKKILVLGLSSLAMAVNFSVVSVSYNFFLAKYGDTVTLAAYSIVGYIGFVYYIISEGICAAIQPIISYNHGANRQYNIRRILRMAIKTLFLLYCLSLIFIFGLTQQIAEAFARNDIVLQKAAVYGLRLHLIGSFLESLVLVGVFYFQAIDKSKTASLFAVINLFIQLPFLLLMSKIWGLTGVWLTNPVENIPLSLLALFLMRKTLRKSVFAYGKRTSKPSCDSVE